MSISVQPLPGTVADPLYPDSDGEPVGETEYHFVALWHVYGALAHWYRRREDVHVAGNMLLYYEKGNPSAVRGPDIMVSKGVRGKHPRRSFRIWEECTVPTVILEITSAKTRAEDQGPKPLVYADIGVKEYFMFDTQGEYLHPRLQGFQLIKGKYVSLPADESGRIFSRELGLVLVADNFLLRLVDPATGKALPTEDEYIEQIARAKRAARKAKSEAAEAKREAVAAKRAEDAAKRDEAKAKQAADTARGEAESQRRRAAELEAELARLRAKLPSENPE
ncbi:MAG TPA: Uma2 family endonuclease [Pirellulales bacterium]